MVEIVVHHHGLGHGADGLVCAVVCFEQRARWWHATSHSPSRKPPGHNHMHIWPVSADRESFHAPRQSVGPATAAYRETVRAHAGGRRRIELPCTTGDHLHYSAPIVCSRVTCMRPRAVIVPWVRRMRSHWRRRRMHRLDCMVVLLLLLLRRLRSLRCRSVLRMRCLWCSSVLWLGGLWCRSVLWMRWLLI
jgi:hypothetical protein